MKESTIRLTPALAAKWLARHKQANGGTLGNWRGYTESHAEFLAYEMIGGRFVPDLSKIALGPDGFIIDGQHRIMAVLLSDMPVTFTVVEDAPRDWGKFADCGKTRTVAQRLQVASRLTSVASTLLRVAYRNPSAGTAQATEEVLATFKPAFDRLEAVKGWAGKQKQAPAPVRAMMLLRTMELGQDTPLDMYGAFLRGDLERLALDKCSGLLSLYKSALDDTLQPMGNVGAQRAAVVAYLTLSNPKRKSLTKPQEPGESVKAVIWPVFARIMGVRVAGAKRPSLPGKRVSKADGDRP